jgi:hypothetical protein
MKLLNVSDDDIDYNSSKWLLEYARIVGCDRFSVDIEVKEVDFAVEYQKKLLSSLDPYYLGSEDAKIVVLYGDESDVRHQKMWSLNHDSIPIILRFMGHHLLDDMIAANEGISGWRFYKGKEILACAVYCFDYFYFIEPPATLINILGSKAVAGNS